MPIRVVLADDHPTLLVGVRTVLEATGAMTVVAEARSPGKLIAALSRVTCDVLVMDYLMPGGDDPALDPALDLCAPTSTRASVNASTNTARSTVVRTARVTAGSTPKSTAESTTVRDGLYLLRAVRRTYPALPIVVFTMLNEDRMRESVITSGANAVLCKTEPIDILPKTLRLVMSGHLLMRPTRLTAGTVPLSCFSQPDENQCLSSCLSRREAEVIRMLLSGQSLQEVARHFARSAKTISNQKRSAMQKLGVDNDIELARLAADAGFC